MKAEKSQDIELARRRQGKWMRTSSVRADRPEAPKEPMFQKEHECWKGPVFQLKSVGVLFLLSIFVLFISSIDCMRLTHVRESKTDLFGLEIQMLILSGNILTDVQDNVWPHIWAPMAHSSWHMKLPFTLADWRSYPLFFQEGTDEEEQTEAWSAALMNVSPHGNLRYGEGFFPIEAVLLDSGNAKTESKRVPDTKNYMKRIKPLKYLF